MNAIGPGDFVECIDAGPRVVPGWGTLSAPSELRVGAIYVVAGLNYDAYYDDYGLILAGVPAPWGFDGYSMTRFRPDERLIRDLLQPVKEDA